MRFNPRSGPRAGAIVHPGVEVERRISFNPRSGPRAGAIRAQCTGRRNSDGFNPRSGPRAGAIRCRCPRCGCFWVSIRAPVRGPERSTTNLYSTALSLFQSALRSEGRSDKCGSVTTMGRSLFQSALRSEGRSDSSRHKHVPHAEGFNPRSGPRAGAMAHRFAAGRPGTYLGDFANDVKEPNSGAVNGTEIPLRLCD